MMMGRVQQCRAVVREMSIRQALEWAFSVEHAQLEFDEYRADGERPGTDTIWRLMRQGQLGCEIDGGGRSLPHDDADIIASFVARLPNGCGGKAMAVQIAELARAGRAPDWCAEGELRCVPVEWRNSKHGPFARTQKLGTTEVMWRGRIVKHDVIWCPVTYLGTAREIAAARRNYIGWCSALLDLLVSLRSAGLTSIVLTPAMPPLRPWAEDDRSKAA